MPYREPTEEEFLELTVGWAGEEYRHTRKFYDPEIPMEFMVCDHPGGIDVAGKDMFVYLLLNGDQDTKFNGFNRMYVIFPNEVFTISRAEESYAKAGQIPVIDANRHYIESWK